MRRAALLMAVMTSAALAAAGVAAPAALASGPSPGTAATPLIAVVTQTRTSVNGELLVKQGSLTAAWSREHGGVAQAAVATDPVHGPLIAAVTASGELLVKQGRLNAPWNHEHSGIYAVAVATDPVHGPLIVAVTTKGVLLAKDGSLSAAWTTEYGGGLNEVPAQFAAASDAVHGPLIGLITGAASCWSRRAAWPRPGTTSTAELTRSPWPATPGTAR
jgi:hypothetical protein